MLLRRRGVEELAVLVVAKEARLSVDRAAALSCMAGGGAIIGAGMWGRAGLAVWYASVRRRDGLQVASRKADPSDSYATHLKTCTRTNYDVDIMAVNWPTVRSSRWYMGQRYVCR